MKTPTGHEKVIIFSVLWTAVICGVVVGIGFPLYIRLQNFQGVHEEQSIQLHELEERIEKFGALKRDYERVSSKLPFLRSGFLDPDNAVSFIEIIEQLGRDAAVRKEIRLASRRTGSASEEPPYLSFQLTLVGPFRNVFESVVRLENLQYYVDIERLNLARPGVKEFVSQPSGESDVSTIFSGDVRAYILFRVHTAPNSPS